MVEYFFLLLEVLLSSSVFSAATGGWKLYCNNTDGESYAALQWLNGEEVLRHL